MSVRTYNPSVRVGNWNEDIQLEEDSLKDFLTKREQGQLLFQRTHELKNSTLKHVNTSSSTDGHIRIGDVVRLVNPNPCNKTRKDSVLALNPADSCTAGGCGVSGAHADEQPCVRTSFIIEGTNSAEEADNRLQYEQTFLLKAVSGDQYLQSDRASFTRFAKKSRHNEVRVLPDRSHAAEWQVVPWDPHCRMELKGACVPANTPILLRHVKTNEALCLEAEYRIQTPFGCEFEVSAYTDLDSHKAETDRNKWVISMNTNAV